MCKISKCRVCQSDNLKEVINLGNLHLSGIFPKIGEFVEKSPIELCRCVSCGLVQLFHTYDLSKMYGNSYGYHSSLNKSMVNHLKDIVDYINTMVDIGKDDYILDIGSNDGTTLQQYKQGRLVGVDPTIDKFKHFYTDEVKTFCDFFPSKDLNSFIGNNKFKVITSIACFYDLESPIDFAREVSNLLSNDGIWIIEQSYLFSMVNQLAFDTICHEHLEYYGVNQIQYIADKANLKIIDVNFNDTNGGSFMVTLAKKESKFSIHKVDIIDIVLYCEKEWNCSKTFDTFKNDIINYKDNINKFFKKTKKSKKNIVGYGASTKGNILLQYCEIDNKKLPYIVEVNKDKFGCETPGTRIPIKDERKIDTSKIDLFFVLPWHFKKDILNRYTNRDYKFAFPLPLELKIY
jgi:hypothetical protein